MVIINADDWGRDSETTDRTLDCLQQGTVSSVSAMVFMEDSERAAVLARQRGVDAGIHLNFTTVFTEHACPPLLVEHQHRLTRFLRSSRYASIVYHPGLVASFEYAVKSQLDEFERLYGTPATRVDGHHHMHLCSNVLYGELMPAGTIARRSQSFAPGEKSWINRRYRRWLDSRLIQRHRLVDYLLSLESARPLDRLQQVTKLAEHAVVELETHPINPKEYQLLTSGQIFVLAPNLQIARHF